MLNIIAMHGTKPEANRVYKELENISVQCDITISTYRYFDEVSVTAYAYSKKASNEDKQTLLENGFTEFENEFGVKLISKTYTFDKKTKKEIMPVLYD